MSPRLRRNVLATLAFGVVVVAITVVSDAGVLSAAKARVEAVDVRTTGGVLRRLAFGPLSAPDLGGIPAAPPDAYAWLESRSFLAVAHGLGPDVGDGPNTISAMERAFELGFRTFEVDLAATVDRHVVCYHGGSDEDLTDLTWRRYVSAMRDSGRTPCEFADLVAAVRRHPGISIILDVKTDFDRTYDLLRPMIDTAVGRAFIPQLYRFEQVRAIRADGRFAGEIFTSYRSGLQTREILRLARVAGIRAVTLTLPRFREIAGRVPLDLVVFAHPVDDATLAWWLRSKGAGGIYSSVLGPCVVPGLYGLKSCATSVVADSVCRRPRAWQQR